MDFVTDLIAKLSPFMSAVVCSPVTPRLWSRFRHVPVVEGRFYVARGQTRTLTPNYNAHNIGI
jgi:hypothetical protein